MISILIPTHNDDCLNLATSIVQQASAIKGLSWELIVADDASTDSTVVEHNSRIAKLPNCHVFRQETNVGRAVIRNLLAEHANGEWMLYIDGDGQIILDDYLLRFIKASRHATVCYGGYRMMPGPEGNLRWRYERAAAPALTAMRRQAHPYRCFNISNLLISRELILAHPLDNRFVNYGYEDVMLGRDLREAGIDVLHIDAPIGFYNYEDNVHFVAKTEEGVRTLYHFRHELIEYSHLLQVVGKLNKAFVTLYLLVFRLLKGKWRKNLIGPSPSLWLFKCYKLGYYLSLSQRAGEPTAKPSTRREPTLPR